MVRAKGNLSLAQRDLVSREISSEYHRWKRTKGTPSARQRKQIVAIGFSKARKKDPRIPKVNPVDFSTKLISDIIGGIGFGVGAGITERYIMRKLRKNPQENPPRFAVLDPAGTIVYTKTARGTGTEALRDARQKARELAERHNETYFVWLSLHHQRGDQMNLALLSDAYPVRPSTGVHSGSMAERNPAKLLTKADAKRLPPIRGQENIPDPIAYVKFFTPDANWTWYATEFDGRDEFFGLVQGLDEELGYFSLSQLTSVRGPMGLEVERDLYFRPTPLSMLTKQNPLTPRFGTASNPLVKGENLTPRQRQAVLDAFIYRWTVENLDRAKKSFGSAGYPRIDPIPDEQWLQEHAFWVTGDRLSAKRHHAEPAYLADDPEYSKRHNPEIQGNPLLMTVLGANPRRKRKRNPKSTFKAGDKAIIRNVVGRLHVGTPDAEVAAHVLSKIKKSAKLPKSVLGEIRRFAVAVHRQNQKLYRDVAGGRIGRNKRRSTRRLKNPGKSKKKITMSIAKFAAWLKRKGDSKLLAEFKRKVEGYTKWTHGTKPKTVTLELKNVPGMKGVWMTYGMGTQPESTYIMPKGSKRKGAWKHEWERHPKLVGDPESGLIVTQLVDGNKLTDFMHG